MPKIDRRIRHGGSGTRLYKIWAEMWSRCRNPNRDCWPRYGGRGIKVCQRWRDFAKFREDMGEPPLGATLDRKDGDGPYSPANCRWASRKEQRINQRRTNLVTLAGRTQCLSDWAKELGLSIRALRMRLARGWAEDRILETKPLPLGFSRCLAQPGRRFRDLIVLRDGPRQAGRSTWVCRCVCGTERPFSSRDLRLGKIKSCGCVRPGGKRSRYE